MVTKVDFQELRHAELFKNLPDDILRQLAQHCHYVELAAGETLFHQGDSSDALYVLMAGQIHVIRSYPSGEEVVLATEGPYYVVGGLSMLANQPRTGGVVAVADCTLIALDREAFVDVCERVPGVAATVLNYVSRRLYRLNLLVREHAIGNVAARVASVLLLLADKQAGPIKGEVPVSRVARAVAMDADSVERLFSDWTDDGIIGFDGQQITIHEVESLQNIAG